MIYRCAACGRRLLKPAYTAPASMGGWMLGPVCAAKATALPGMGDKPKGMKPKVDLYKKPRHTRPAKMRKARKQRQRAPSPTVLPGQMALDLNATEEFHS